MSLERETFRKAHETRERYSKNGPRQSVEGGGPWRLEGLTEGSTSELTFRPESVLPHSPLSYHHLFFSLSKTACSLCFNTARFIGILQPGK